MSDPESDYDSWKTIYYSTLGDSKSESKQYLHDIDKQPKGERIYHINNSFNGLQERMDIQKHWHWILGHIEDILFSKHIHMEPIELVGICNIDTILQLPVFYKMDNIGKHIFLAGPILRKLICYDRLHTEGFESWKSLVELEFFIVGETSEERQQTLEDYVHEMTRTTKKSVVVTRTEERVHLKKKEHFDITIHVTESPTIQHFVMEHFGYSDRVWACIMNQDVFTLPSTEYALKTILPHSMEFFLPELFHNRMSSKENESE